MSYASNLIAALRGGASYDPAVPEGPGVSFLPNQPSTGNFAPLTFRRFGEGEASFRPPVLTFSPLDRAAVEEIKAKKEAEREAERNAKNPASPPATQPIPPVMSFNSPLPEGVQPGQTFDADGRIYSPTTQVSGDQQGDAYIGGTFYDVVSPYMNYQEAMGSIPEGFVPGQPYVYTPSVAGYEPSGPINTTTYVPSTITSGDDPGHVLIGGQHWYNAVPSDPGDRYTNFSWDYASDWSA